jgi:ferric iron reductase protein FhuF
MDLATKDVRAVLKDVAGLGPFFTVSTESGAVGGDWRPVLDLQTDPAPLAARIAHVRGALGSPDGPEVDVRVAASVSFQGLAALVVSAPFAAAVLHGVLPEMAPEALYWRATESGPWPMWCPTPGAIPVADEATAAASLAAALLDVHLEPLVSAVRVQVPIAERVLWGNAASAVASAKRLVVAQRPRSAERAAVVAQRLLDVGRFAGTGDLLPPVEPDRLWSFRRRSCCLFYRVPGGGLCGDCVLQDRRR